MTAHYTDDTVTLYHGDALDVLAELDDASVDAVVTDPPYGISFMGKQWDQPDQYGSQRRGGSDRPFTAGAVGVDHKTTTERSAAMHAGKYDLPPSALLTFQQWCEAWATECLRILKPGSHLLVFGGTRTWHRLAVAVEDAGFEVRDSIAWMYGSGFPKSLDVSKAIDKAAGAERPILDTIPDRWAGKGDVLQRATQAEAESVDITAPATDAARQWQGWGTALKPAFEPVVVARKPLVGTVAANVLAHGTGALNIDGARIGTESTRRPLGKPLNGGAYGSDRDDRESLAAVGGSDSGRWPANVVLDESQAAALDEQSGTSKGRVGMTQHGSGTNSVYGNFDRTEQSTGGGSGVEDAGGASRFFYVAREGGNPCPSPSRVSGAESLSSPPSESGVSALGGAATSDSPEEIFRSHSTEPSTSDMVSASRPNDDSDTRPTPSTADGSSPESQPARHTQTPSPARHAATNELTDTTTTTTSQPRSDGSADAATSNTTYGSREAGALDSLAGRFMYTAKAPGEERVTVNGIAHPTCKPLDLMRWLVRLVTPPGGTVLEPFAGSGTTVEACILERFNVIAVEREADYLPLITQRINRRRDPAAYVEAAGEDMGLFGLIDEEGA